MLLKHPIQPEEKREQNLCRDMHQMLSRIGQCISIEKDSTALHWLNPAPNGLKRCFNLATSIVLGYKSWEKEFESAYGQLIGKTTSSPQYNLPHLPKETSFIRFSQKSATPPVVWRDIYFENEESYFQGQSEVCWVQTKIFCGAKEIFTGF